MTRRRNWSRAYRRRRDAVLRREPICRVCKDRLAEQVDHIVPWHRGGNDLPDNLQPICRTCHREKTRRESRTHPPNTRPATPKLVHADGSPISPR